MRSSKSRSRSKSNRNRPNGVNVVNRVFDSSGPEGKVRGTPQQIIDKYNQLTRDAQLSNDRVAAENFQQHAEHYLRLLNEAQREIDARREDQERQNRERQADRDRERSDRQEREVTPNQAAPSQGQQRPAPSSEQPQPSQHQASHAAPVARQGAPAAAPQQDLANAPQPEMLDPRDAVSATAPEGSGLVETPESKGQEPAQQPKKPVARKPRPRKPAAKPVEGASVTSTEGGEAPDVTDAPKEAKPKRAPRARAKPKPKAEDAPEAAE
jgi:hypothetical protein